VAPGRGGSMRTGAAGVRGAGGGHTDGMTDTGRSRTQTGEEGRDQRLCGRGSGSVHTATSRRCDPRMHIGGGREVADQVGPGSQEKEDPKRESARDDQETEDEPDAGEEQDESDPCREQDRETHGDAVPRDSVLWDSVSPDSAPADGIPASPVSGASAGAGSAASCAVVTGPADGG